MNNKIRHKQILLKGISTHDDIYFMLQIGYQPTYKFVPRKLGYDNSTLDDQSISAPQTAWPPLSVEPPPIGQLPPPPDSSPELKLDTQMPPFKMTEP